jgi:hypothetical protein
MDIMAGGTAQCIEIYTLFLEPRMIPDIPTVTTATSPVLGFFSADRVGFCMHCVAGGAIDSRSVMYAAHKHDFLLSHAFIRVA